MEEDAARAATHLPKALRDWLIFFASSRRVPRFSLEFSFGLSVGVGLKALKNWFIFSASSSRVLSLSSGLHLGSSVGIGKCSRLIFSRHTRGPPCVCTCV